MVRHLPWKRESSSQKRDGAEAEPSLPPRRASSARHSVSTSASGLRRHIDSTRSPSTSPPPERPVEQFMVPGPLADDKYRMVEDEFLAVAQRFTAHLHRAEYERLKALALARGRHAPGLSGIERPVVAGVQPTPSTRWRREAARRRARQRGVLRAGGDGQGEAGAEVEETGSGAAAPGEGGLGLRRLMDAPGARGRDIRVQAVPVSRGTRAAAGFASARGEGGSESQSQSQSQRVEEPPAGGRDGVGSVVSEGWGMDRGKRRRVGFLPEGGEDQDRVDGPGEDDDVGDLFGIRARGLQRRKSREQMKRAADEQRRKSQAELDIIPAFL